MAAKWQNSYLLNILASSCLFFLKCQWLLSSKSGIEVGHNIPPILGSGSPQFLTQVFPSDLGFPF